MELEQSKKPGLIDYLGVMYKWKSLILSIVIFITAVSVVISYLIPEKFKASTVVVVPQGTEMGLGGLTGLLGGKSSTAALGAKLFGISSSSEDMLLGILNSRTSLVHVVERYNLAEYYEIDDGNTDKILRAFTKDVVFSPNEWGMIEIEVINEDPKLAAEMANYFVVLLDSLNRKINVEQATNNRLFIEKRYLQNVLDLKNAEDSLYIFQKKYGVFAVPEQLEAAVKASAELESQIVKQEIALLLMQEQFGKTSQQAALVEAELKLLKNKVSELKLSDKLSNPSNVFLPFKEVPSLTLQYFRYFREIEIQSKILEVVLPLYEQAKVEEQKSLPTVMVLDPAVPPMLKDSPKRMLIVLFGFFISFFGVAVIVFTNEYFLKTGTASNALEVKMRGFANWCKRFFRVSDN
ncbi:MAG: Wzz/FepE/Etk N-terminal domain-containing protein [Ignavibacteriaceae bacterium]|nr:Wzz/FepE/Etk N-terminal domain-containing protein [Ignavibacteriaceae bacterium]